MAKIPADPKGGSTNNPKSIFDLLGSVSPKLLLLLLLVAAFLIAGMFLFAVATGHEVRLFKDAIIVGPTKEQTTTTTPSIPSYTTFTGQVSLSDAANPKDANVCIYRCYPAINPNTDGSYSIQVAKNPDGTFPHIGIVAEGYYSADVDLNNPLSMIDTEGNTRIMRTIKLDLSH
jgi:hypothetical protein